jgi:bifunctional non-homologous end joining protein LigD
VYHSGRRTREWLKVRNLRAARVRVGGWLPSTGRRRNVTWSVLIGLPRPGALEFAGTVGSGLSMAELRELTALLEAVEQPVSPFAGPLPAAITWQARWARPVLVAEVSDLPGRHPVRAAAPTGPARTEARASCEQPPEPDFHVDRG